MTPIRTILVRRCWNRRLRRRSMRCRMSSIRTMTSMTRDIRCCQGWGWPRPGGFPDPGARASAQGGTALRVGARCSSAGLWSVSGRRSLRR
ncbi:hypothetical protein FB473_003237 [Brooklawnia cerclae]|uniref:Uncharacterized protein n=1 Tax=Brooklawnia cerclae TaxID=349934 RepID=A0ABX0SKN5_9ACTN|nr:hypothetical protein [Brooklawnia cerclae]